MKDVYTFACRDFNIKCDFGTQPYATIDGAIKKAQEHSKDKRKEMTRYRNIEWVEFIFTCSIYSITT